VINPLTGARPYPQYGQIELRAKDGDSIFNGLQLGAQRFLTRGWMVTANYAWSHAIDDGSLGSGVEDVFPQNVSCRRCDRASSLYDARQSAAISTIYELPFGAGKSLFTSGPMSHILGGWELSAVGGGRSGLPVNITVDRSAAVMPDGNSGNQRPNYIPGASLIPVGGSTPLHWINIGAFTVPAPETWGNLGRNAFRGPALWQIDTALRRRFTLREKTALELRVECFNLLNRAQYGNPLADISAPATFGRITTLVNTTPVGSGTPRQFELAARLSF
jgi:hypothetical protein